MQRRRSLGLVAAGVVAATLWPGSAVWAQLGDPTDPPAAGAARRTAGSVTITSDPSGAIVTLDGRGLHLVGRTPWTIRRGLDGIFTVRSHLDTHEQWRSTVYLDPATDQTIHMEISAKTPAKAGLRSLVLPGWGQHYSDRDVPGLVYFGSAVAAGVYLGIRAVQYEDRVDDIQVAWDAYAESSVQSEREVLWEEVERRRELADDAQSRRATAWVILGAVWGVNLLDALFFFPDTSTPVVTSSGGVTGLFVEPRSDGVDLGLRVGY